MSNKFTQIKIEKENEKIKLKPQYNENISEELKQNKSIETLLSTPIVLGIVKTPEQNFSKNLVECSINLLYDTIMSLDRSVKNFGDRTSVCDVDIEMINQFRQIAQLLVYTVNSTSWRKGKYYTFDSVEIKQRLDTIKHYCDYTND